MYFLNFIKQLINDKITNYKIVDIIIKLWLGFMVLLVIAGLSKMVYELIINPSQFNNTQFGIFDYI